MTSPSKTATVCYKGSYQKYSRVFEDHLIEIKDGILTVYERDHSTGDEQIKAQFKDWDYYQIEEDIF